MPVTLAGFPQCEPVQVGTLMIEETGPQRRPTLLMQHWDPYARQFRRVPMPRTMRADSVVDVATVTVDGRALMMAIVPDPTKADEAQAVLDEFKRLDQAWRSKSKPSGKPAREAPLLGYRRATAL